MALSSSELRGPPKLKIGDWPPNGLSALRIPAGTGVPLTMAGLLEKDAGGVARGVPSCRGLVSGAKLTRFWAGLAPLCTGSREALPGALPEAAGVAKEAGAPEGNEKAPPVAGDNAGEEGEPNLKLLGAAAAAPSACMPKLNCGVDCLAPSAAAIDEALAAPNKKRPAAGGSELLPPDFLAISSAAALVAASDAAEFDLRKSAPQPSELAGAAAVFAGGAAPAAEPAASLCAGGAAAGVSHSCTLFRLSPAGGAEDGAGRGRGFP
mmetsp:Transcript_34551/g.97907  ORF Transcript_34551/g.97907 Transcript_34551/m.97907 type:complete len:265 (-) Transcript_34551:30-824(-)